MQRKLRPLALPLALLLAALSASCGGDPDEAELALAGEALTAIPTATGAYSPSAYRIVVANDLGMHCYDIDYSVLSLLPPFNTLHAQVIDLANKKILTDKDVSVRYSAVADPAGLVNTTSVGKTNFWKYAPKLYGATLAADTGLLGQKMPGAANTPQPFGTFDTTHGWFAAAGIPVTSRSDSLVNDYYPMFRIEAVSKTGQVLASTDAVAPVSNEMHCSTCHNTGKIASKDPGASWSAATNSTLQYRNNILILHDLRHKTSLLSQKPVLCASCHYSPALDLAGTGPSAKQQGVSLLSHAIHGRHGKNLANSATGTPVVADSAAGCYSCHPGSATKCLRGAMGSAGITCQNCHGGMLAVASHYPRPSGTKRTPWLEEPGCQSCHTGDAVSHATVNGAMAADGIRLTQAFTPGDKAAIARQAPTSRFAENQSLYRFSNGHGGVFCEGCHNSTHAEWPSSSGNDNLTASAIQGHAGVVAECASCHNPVPLTADKGPHGMHTIGASWVKEHHDLTSNPSPCKACHGATYQGSALAKTKAARTFQIDNGGTKTYAAGQVVTCYDCHNGPNGG